MSILIAFVLVLFVLFLVVLAYRLGLNRGARGAHAPEQGVQDQTSRKNENKQMIIDILEEHGKLSNADLRKHLDVSPRTVVNYLDELEKEGKVAQVGDVGQGVVYRLL